MPTRFVAVLLTTLLGLVQIARAEPVEVAVKLASGSEIVSQRYPATGSLLAVWITGQYGRVEEEHKAATDLAAAGVETWVTDILSPYFLPLLPSSLNLVPDRDLGDWLEALRLRNPGRRILLIAGGRAASLVLRGVHAWRAQYAADAAGFVRGAVLLFPLLYQELLPGQDPDYDPVVAETRMDLVILQPRSSAGYWWRDRLKQVLESAGSRVRLDVLPGLRDGFYERSDINTQEVAAGTHLGQILLDGLRPWIEKP